MKHVFKASVAAAVAALALVPVVEATTARRLTNQDLTDQADVIVVGSPLEQRTQWIERDLVTLVTLQVSETLKGATGETLTVVLPGGVDANRRFPVAVTFPGAPTIRAGEEVMLFLVAGEAVADAYAVAGFSQGKFSVIEDPGGVKLVSRDLTQVDLVGKGGATRGTRTLTRLSDFREEIRGYLARGR